MVWILVDIRVVVESAVVDGNQLEKRRILETNLCGEEVKIELVRGVSSENKFCLYCAPGAQFVLIY